MKARDPYHLLSLWKARVRLTIVMLIVACFVVLLVAYQQESLSFISVLIVGALGLAGITWLGQKSFPHLHNVLGVAHAQNEKLQYSAQLLESGREKKDEPSGLVTMQREKAKEAFSSFSYKLPWDENLIKKSLLLMISLTIGAWSLESLISSPPPYIDSDHYTEQSSVVDDKVQDDFMSDSAFIKSIAISITPPEYTGLPTRILKQSSLNVIEGSKISWDIKTNKQVDKLFIVFSDRDTINLRTGIFSKTLNRSDFYQIGIKDSANDYISDYHSIKVVLDEKPEVAISGIKEYTKLDYQPDYKFSFDIAIEDDYGLEDAFISATVAKGSGESVKFREKKFDLKSFAKGSRNFKGSHSFSTSEFGMEPGDELFFYVSAKDNYPITEHWSKSITHFVSIKDTTSYVYTDDSGMQVDLMPDFFRSQRQIIIDTEKLMAEKSSLHIDTFKHRSNALGYDQKLLRLKYGQFLGEENESGININNEISLEGDDHDHEEDHDHDHDHGGASEALQGARDLLSQFMHDHDHEEEAGLLMATKGTEKREDPARPTWVEELSHNHDDSEVATFHNISVKSKLKAALSVMWDAELHLRLYDPGSSLPFQYESLELLQEVKNHARIYVHRIGFDPPVIKEQEIRLGGEQDKISAPSLSQTIENTDAYIQIKNAIKVLGAQSPKLHIEKLQLATSSLAQLSLYRPELSPLLTEMQAMLRSIDVMSSSDISKVRNALIDILPEESQKVVSRYSNTLDLTKEVTRKLSF